MDTNKNKSSGLSTAGMVLGIIAIVLSFIPIVNNVAFVLAVLAFIFGIIALAKKQSKGKAITAIILAVLSIVITLSMQAIFSNALKSVTTDNNTQSTTQQTSSEVKPKLTLNDGWSLDKSNPYITKVVGSVANNSDEAIKGYIQITFSALDASGANVGDCLANANTVDAHGTWKFEAMCSGNNIATARFKDLSGF